MKFNILIIGQSGRLQYEAILFLASLRQSAPDFNGQVFVAEPQHNERWDQNPAITDPEIREVIENLGGKITPFENTHFGGYYPYGNKIEALSVLPEGEPFVFFDTDTLITGALDRVPFDFERPSASLKVEGTWPVIELYGPGYTATWKSLYDKFKLDFESSLDVSQPDEYWRRYLYFNAGYFYYKCPKIFGDRFLNYALAIRDDGPKELVCQELDPWLDQVALPLVIHSFGGPVMSLRPAIWMGPCPVTIASCRCSTRARVIWRSKPWRRPSRPIRSRKSLRPMSPFAEWFTKNAVRRCGRCLIKITCPAKRNRSETQLNAPDFGCADLRP